MRAECRGSALRRSVCPTVPQCFYLGYPECIILRSLALGDRLEIIIFISLPSGHYIELAILNSLPSGNYPQINAWRSLS